MECFKMYCILINVLIVAIKVSEAADIQFERQEPKILVIGDNVTFHWLYIGEKNVTIIQLYIDMEGSVRERMVYYAISLPNPQVELFPEVLEKYATTVKWAGNVLKNKYAFTLVNVSQSCHEKSFSLQLNYHDFTTQRNSTKEPLFISVLPKVHLRVDKTNVSVGDRVTIECRMINRGRPAATILWYHNKSLLDGKTERYLFRENEVEKKDAGSYSCAGKNNAGVDMSEVITIAVHGGKNKKDNPSARDSSGGLGGGEIAGLVFGILIVVIFIIVLVFVLRRQKNKPKSDKRETVNEDESKSAMVPEAGEKDQVWL